MCPGLRSRANQRVLWPLSWGPQGQRSARWTPHGRPRVQGIFSTSCGQAPHYWPIIHLSRAAGFPVPRGCCFVPLASFLPWGIPCGCAPFFFPFRLLLSLFILQGAASNPVARARRTVLCLVQAWLLHPAVCSFRFSLSLGLFTTFIKQGRLRACPIPGCRTSPGVHSLCSLTYSACVYPTSPPPTLWRGPEGPHCAHCTGCSCPYPFNCGCGLCLPSANQGLHLARHKHCFVLVLAPMLLCPSLVRYLILCGHAHDLCLLSLSLFVSWCCLVLNFCGSRHSVATFLGGLLRSETN